MRPTMALLLCLLAAARVLASPASAVAAALADARTLPPAQCRHVRYLSMYNLAEGRRAEALKVLAFHVNSLSREPDLTVPALVCPDLVRVNLCDYGWDPKTWEKFAEVDPYFHALIEVDEVKFYQAGNYNGRYYAAGNYKTGRKSKQTAAAPWLPAAAIAELITLTQSQAPVLRADWFLNQTAIQADRKIGYYGMLGLGNKEADFQNLIGADVAAAKRVKREVAAVVTSSIVTLHNRSMYRLGSITGSYWFTLDFKTNVQKQNVLRLLNGDLEPPKGDASEQYGTLPNGLFAFWLQDAAGTRQDSAPDFIASDSESTGTDRRVHVGLSCIRCHVEGIRPIDDWMRKVYQAPLALQSPDYEKLKRLQSLYLSDLDRWIRRDNQDYADVLHAVNGLTPAANARAYAAFWDLYQEAPVSPATAAREMGLDEQVLLARLKSYAAPPPVGTGSVDPVLASWLRDPPLPVRREHWEEVFGTAMLAAGGIP